MDVDSRGNLWVAASGLGLARFDGDLGVKWFKRGTVENSTRTVLVDRSDRVWTADDNGIFQVENDRLIPVDLGPVTRNNIRKMFQDDEGNLYLATSSNGVLKYGEKENPFKA